nr:hypothetical protein [Tanacetum cinerariifolium]
MVIVYCIMRECPYISGRKSVPGIVAVNGENGKENYSVLTWATQLNFVVIKLYVQNQLSQLRDLQGHGQSTEVSADILSQAKADIQKNGVSAALDSAATTLPPGQSLGSNENTTRFLVPSDVCKDQLSSGIFTSSLYDDDFRATLTNLAPTVAVNPILTKRVNSVHPQS